jgi:hydroxymethylbilane synthase
MKRVIRVGSRESELALAQARWIISKIKGSYPGLEFEIVGIKTKGDIILDSRLDKVGGKGLFIKEIENALLGNRIDIAVHSMKDMPAEIPDELIISAVSKREDPVDVLITADGKKLEDLKQGAVIGTGSSRREVQLSGVRPDLKFELLRGNVITRIKKLVDNQYDGIILAAAGLRRLGLYDNRVYRFSIDEMIPAVCQGILAVESRKSEDMHCILDSVHDRESELCSTAERAFMIELNGGCTTPMAAHAVIEGGNMKVYGMLASGDKERLVRSCVEGSINEAHELGLRLAAVLISMLHDI